jgi:hypothetical protein
MKTISLFFLAACTLANIPKPTTAQYPLGQVARAAIQGGVGLSDFISHVRNLLGKAGDFADKNGFNYNNVYNSLLQYSVLNTYLERENHGLLVQQHDLQVASSESSYKFNLIQTISLFFLLALATVSMITGILHANRMARRRRPLLPRTLLPRNLPRTPQTPPQNY